jgi:hypothetical protein
VVKRLLAGLAWSATHSVLVAEDLSAMAVMDQAESRGADLLDVVDLDGCAGGWHAQGPPRHCGATAVLKLEKVLAEDAVMGTGRGSTRANWARSSSASTGTVNWTAAPR